MEIKLRNTLSRLLPYLVYCMSIIWSNQILVTLNLVQAGVSNHNLLIFECKTVFLGQLTYWICKSTEQQDGISLLLVEKASPKHKKDNKLAKTTDKVQRIRADISDLVLDKLDVISKTQHIVGVTKHLCGGATG